MRFAYFLSFFEMDGSKSQITADHFDRLVEIISHTPGLVRGLIFRADHNVGRYYPNDDAPPCLALQLYFDTIEDLEQATSHNGHLQQLVALSTLLGLKDAAVQQQAMVVRRFKEDDQRHTARVEPFCSYLVHYPGQADDLNAWLDHYIRCHPPIMGRFPGVREVEICTRLDWRGFLPWPRVDFMQRNKIAFDSADALVAALNSPVRSEMSADFQNFPPFRGGNVHYPLVTTEVFPAA